MSQIRKTSLSLGLLLLLFVFMLSGCGDTNSQSNLDATSGKHPAAWLPTGHKTAANEHPETCTQCHGSDFLGGISKVSCTQAKCHLGNERAVHPLQWGAFAYALHGSYATNNGPASCATALCHGTNLEGVGNNPSCTSCHIGGPTSFHPVAWNSDILLHASYIGQNGSSSCRNASCHGANLQGIFLSGPSCNACHSF